MVAVVLTPDKAVDFATIPAEFVEAFSVTVGATGATPGVFNKSFTSWGWSVVLGDGPKYEVVPVWSSPSGEADSSRLRMDSIMVEDLYEVFVCCSDVNRLVMSHNLMNLVCRVCLYSREEDSRKCACYYV